MAVTSAQFLIEHPEFTEIALALVQAKLDAAELQFDEAAFVDLYDQIVYAQAAHLLTHSAYGQQSELVAGDGTVHSVRVTELKLLSHRRGQITGGGLT